MNAHDAPGGFPESTITAIGPAIPAVAQHPFNNPVADTILRTVDCFDFSVHSVILIEASTVFKTMFSLPQPNGANVDLDQGSNTADRRPIITVTETSEVLDSLLRLTYPIADPALVTLESVRPVLAAALKYDMEEATDLMKRELRTFRDRNPLGVWAVSCILRLEAEAREAADSTLALPQSLSLNDFPPVMGEISAAVYYRLVRYRATSSLRTKCYEFCVPPVQTGQDSCVPSIKESGEEATPSTEASAVPESETIGAHCAFFKQLPYTDIICVSSNGITVPAHRAILAMASSKLREKIAVAVHTWTGDPSSVEQSGSVMGTLELHFQEDGEVLLTLLYFCYDGEPRNSEIDDVACARSVLQSALAYQLSKVVEKAKKWLTRIIEKNPFRMYFVSLGLGDHELANDAAKQSLEQDITFKYCAEMEITPAPPYYRLLRYHQRCHRAVTTRLETSLSHTPPARSTKKSKGSYNMYRDAPSRNEGWRLASATLENMFMRRAAIPSRKTLVELLLSARESVQEDEEESTGKYMLRVEQLPSDIQDAVSEVEPQMIDGTAQPW